MRFLQVLVVVMGVMIVAGLGLIFVTIAHRLSHPHVGPSLAAAPSGTPGIARIELPPGTQVEEMSSAGNRIVLRLRAVDRESLLVLDQDSGRIVARIELSTAGRGTAIQSGSGQTEQRSR